MKEKQQDEFLKNLPKVMVALAFAFTVAPISSHALARNNSNDDATVTDRASQTVEDAARSVSEAAGSTADELRVTNQIRQEIMEDDTLTSKAKNVSVSTDDGKITLEGEVISEAEKAKVANIAKRVGGNLTVENKLVVENP